MATKPLPSQEVLRQLLDYDPETGVLRWKERPATFFRDGFADAWNAKWAGKEIRHVSSDGYIQCRLFNRAQKAHRLIWKLVTGDDPSFIDHIDGNRQNNRRANLRDVDRAANQKNMRLSGANTSGVCGVYLDKRRGTWYARITVNWADINLGTFRSFEDAVAARKEAELRYDFHENHGKAA